MLSITSTPGCDQMPPRARAQKTWRTWTQKEDYRLEELRMQGATAQEIATALNRTVPSVKNRVNQKRVSLAKRRFDKWLSVLHLPLKEAARIMGTTVWAVKQKKRKLRRAGFVIPRLPRANQFGPWEQAEDVSVAALKNYGLVLQNRLFNGGKEDRCLGSRSRPSN